MFEGDTISGREKSKERNGEERKRDRERDNQRERGRAGMKTLGSYYESRADGQMHCSGRKKLIFATFARSVQS